MKKLFTILICALLFQGASAQSQNGLDFDGIDDEVVVSDASSLITTGSGISFGLWVYPRNTAPAFPNFDNFGGFRNNSDADFYIIQIGATSLEARFRNSIGVSFDINYSGLILNAWQHLVFTYDGSNIKLYQNGIEVATQAANGFITNNFEDFVIGNGFYTGGQYNLDGKVDEVVLYNKALTLSEIDCMRHGDIDTTANELMLYYSCNQGLAGLSNLSADTLNGLAGEPAGTLTNFALDGAISNWVDGVNFIGTVNANFCNGTSYNYNGVNYNVAGTYNVNIPLAGGCDSAVVLTLNLLPVDTSLSVSNTLLTAVSSATAYQWVRCDNNFAIIPGATQSTYNVTLNGSYAVIVTEGNCNDTSRCVTLSVESIFENNMGNLTIWPVPATNLLTIKGLVGINNRIDIMDETGRIVKQEMLIGKKETATIDLSDLQKGFYFIITTNNVGAKSTGKFTVLK